MIKLVDTIRGGMEYEEIRKTRDSLKALKALDTIPKRNTIYAELGGQAGIYSLNYDRIFRVNKKVKNSVSFGLELFPSRYDFILFTPVSYNFLFAKKNSHLELGIGLTIFSNRYKVNPNTYYTSPYISNSTIGRGTDYILFASPKIGYRYQRLQGGIFFKVAFSPIINIVAYYGSAKFKNESQFNQTGSFHFFEPFGSLGHVLPWAGISIGYTFNFKKQN
ncbi:MAG: hypothetical protein HY841_08290 [Bacteroidetes bacterium]|nr:hypothetical protein [Bacteroidota bacterium]